MNCGLLSGKGMSYADPFGKEKLLTMLMGNILTLGN